MESLATDLEKVLPKPVSSLANSVNVSWHIFDISSNYVLKKINWADMVINLKDDKLLICFAFTYYKVLTREMPITEVKASLPGNIDVNSMRDYFKTAGFASIFGELDQEMVSMCQLCPDDFIVLPIYESRSHIYMALLNINVDFGIYLQSMYPVASSSNNVYSFCNLFEIEHGLQNHTNITGIQHATSFNLFRALYKSNIAGLTKSSKVVPATEYAYDSKKIILTDTLELPIIVLYNCYNYFPQLQVVWTHNKIVLALPGAKKPTNDSLIRNNKLLSRVYADLHLDKIKPAIPRVMLRKYETNIDIVRKRWLDKYKKYCQVKDDNKSELICQYTNLDKLISQMSRIKLEVQDLCALQSQSD